MLIECLVLNYIRELVWKSWFRKCYCKKLSALVWPCNLSSNWNPDSWSIAVSSGWKETKRKSKEEMNKLHVTWKRHENWKHGNTQTVRKGYGGLRTLEKPDLSKICQPKSARINGIKMIAVFLFCCCHF